MSSPCPACGSPGRLLHLTRDPEGSVQRLTRCRWCRTEYWTEQSAAHVTTDSEYWEDYKFALYDDPAVRASYEARYAAALDLLPVRPTTLLDLGGGIGNFADWAARQGYEVTTSDVDVAAVETARNRGLTAFSAAELDEHVADGSIDVVSLWDVVEHLSDPGIVLAVAARKLKTGGTLLIETPDARFPLRAAVLAVSRATGGKRDYTHPMYYWEHKVYFSETGLRTLCWRHGLATTMVQRWTSPSAKMAATFGEQAEHYGDAEAQSLYGVLQRAYPVAERVVRAAGLGNKLITTSVKA